TVIPAPYFKRYGKLPSLIAFVDGVTAAAVGAITGAAIVLAKRAIVDAPTAVLACVTLLLLRKFRRLQEPIVVAGAAIIGVLIYPLLHG
ncbi:MAG TPA: chromate transporter, partial [Pseudolabrys sp.]|nr:chromate transporter [Pseudolabrys sp.]